MCGIFCMLKFSTREEYTSESKGIDETIQMLDNRGPDRTGRHTASTPVATIQFSGHVLWQQGDQPCFQPVIQDGHVLLMNGDIYSKIENSGDSDTRWLFERILECECDDDFNTLFRNIEGPFSIVYFNASNNSLYFFRDSLGRQSLLIGKSKDALLIASVASNSFTEISFIEMPPLGIYKMDLNLSVSTVTLNPWQHIQTHETYLVQLADVQTSLGFEIHVLEPVYPQWLMTPVNPLNAKWDFESILGDKVFQTPSDMFKFLLSNQDLEQCCDNLTKLLSESVKKRCLATPSRCKKCIRELSDPACTHCRIGILFSGGIDCTILSVLADRFVDSRCPIDLLNVSFEKVRRTNAGKCFPNGTDINYETPDRLSSRDSLEELRILCPNRVWNLIESNITRAELQTTLSTTISALLHPMDTVLDESLGAALWFAARGRSSPSEDETQYTTPCRVLLIGSGADELFGGYTRHRNAFARNGGSWQKLSEELAFDWVRLPSRNLARDDRVIGDHGVTARSPYVEENLTKFVQGLDAAQKCLHTLEKGVGDKLLLRLCAFKLGLKDVCWLRKRALQFGSRIADSKQNAMDKYRVDSDK